MRSRIANSIRRLSYVIGFIALFTGNPTIFAQGANPGVNICAEREALLMTLVEAHGAAPSAASDKLEAESVALIGAQTACANGNAEDGAAFYERLIAEITASLARKAQ